MPETLDEQLQIADVYAAALFELARQGGCIAEMRAELEELVHLLDMEPGFERFLASSVVDDDARTSSLETMFRGKLSDTVLNTLQVMNRHGRAGLLRALLRAYVRRQEHEAGQVEVVATSAVELSEAQKREVAEIAERLSKSKPLIDFVVDPGILGGLILRIGDYRYDNSLRQRLRATRERLVERGERGVRK